MKVVKRSEFCGAGPVNVVMRLSDIRSGALFRAQIGDMNDPHVFVKTTDDKAVCVGEPGPCMPIGEYSNPHAADNVVGYEELNATLVIED